MLKIESVTIQNMHNVDKRTYHFNDITYMYGPNGSGKSTVLQAIQLALLGYIPGSKKLKEVIFSHSNSDQMNVSLKLSDGSEEINIERSWIRVMPKGDIVSSVNITPEGYNIASLVSEIELPIFNFDEFLHMTANKLKDWFIDFLPKADVDVNWSKVLTEAVSGSVPMSSISDFLHSSVESIKNFGAQGTEEIRKANDYFKSMLSAKKSELQRLQNTVQQLVYYDDVDTSVTAGELRQKKVRLETEYSQISTSLNLILQNESTRHKLESEYGELCQSSKDDPICKELEASFEALESQYEEVVSNRTKLLNKIEDCKREIRSLEKIIDGNGICPYSSEACSSMTKILDSAKSKYAQLRAELDEYGADDGQFNDALCSINKSKFEADTKLQQRLRCYAERDALKSKLINVAIPDASQKMLDECRAQLDTCTDDLIRVEANERYDAVIDNLTSNIFKVQQEIEALKIWDKLTGVNGLQTKLDTMKPLRNLQDQISAYLHKFFNNEDIRCEFVLSTKANSFDFGIMRGRDFVPYTQLSSGEKCIYALALMLSIVHASNSELKLILVDDLFDHLDDNNIVNLFIALQSVGDIQMIFAGVKPVSRKLSKTTVIDVCHEK